jgi:hypothetical protein
MTQYTKLQSANAQLKTAITLFFKNTDPLAIETLCGAVLGILHPLANKMSIKGLLNNPDLIPSELESFWYKKLHEVPNFLKHADRDWDAILNYNEAVLPYKLFEATALFDKLNRVLENATKSERYIVIYQFWFGINFSHLIKNEKTEWKKTVNEMKLNLPQNAGKEYFLSLLFE